MPELYEGQASVVAARLAEAELLQEADEADAEAATNPAARSAALRRMAARTTLIAALRRQVERGGEEEGAATRDKQLRIRLSEEEHGRLVSLAAEQGLTVAAYVRQACGIS